MIGSPVMSIGGAGEVALPLSKMGCAMPGADGGTGAGVIGGTMSAFGSGPSSDTEHLYGGGSGGGPGGKPVAPPVIPWIITPVDGLLQTKFNAVRLSPTLAICP